MDHLVSIPSHVSRKRAIVAHLARAARSAVLAGGIAVIAGSSAHSDSLRQALSDASRQSLEISALEAQFRAQQHDERTALAGYFPSLSATGTLGVESSRLVGSDFTTNRPAGLTLQLNQVVFDGGSTGARVEQARVERLIVANSLRATRGRLLVDSARAYLDVKSSREIVRIRKQDLRRVDEQLQSTQQRFQIGEMTRTDVAQAKARRSRAFAALQLAQSSVESQNALFEQIIGRPPVGSLRGDDVTTDLLPASLRVALRIARTNSFAIKASQLAVKLADAQVHSALSSTLPRLNLTGSANLRWPDINDVRSDQFSVAATLSIPIFSGGALHSTLRSARAVRARRRIELDYKRRVVDASTVAAWTTFTAAVAQVRSSIEVMRAARAAYSGVKEEAGVGQRTTLDVLNARQELLDAEVERVKAQQSRIVAAVSLLNTIGTLSPGVLRL